MFPSSMFDSSESSNMVRARDDEYDSKSGTDTMDVPSSDDAQQPNQKKGFHRHTQHQIQEMESFFKECPHPDDKQRKELARVLGLEPLQVKFWFQNKRTQMKAHHERYENTNLRAENEKLRAENNRYKEALSNASSSCPTCGGPASLGEMSFEEQHLRIENARLREEIDRLSSRIAANGTETGMVGEVLYGVSDLLRSIPVADADKPMIVELAVAAMEELTRLAHAREPLWVPTNHRTEILNEEEYLRTFPKPLGLIRSEASRESVVVIMNHTNLVDMLMDVNKWSTVFCGIVSRALTLEVLSTGVARTYNGALQVMSAEFQVPSPLVATRENYFLRYCKQHSDGIWAVVDVSLDNYLRPYTISRSRKRPSGCLIQELPNGYSKVTWVEHVEVDDRAVHNIYRPLVNSGLAFGAKRWVATLDRQCERLASSMAINIPPENLCGIVIISREGRKSMLKLAERMMINFCSGVGASVAHAWTTLSSTGGSDGVRVMTRKSMDDPGKPPGVVLNAATSLWLPVPPKRIFDFLRGENSRSEWDILSNGGIVEEVAHIANGRDPGNSVSLLRVNGASSSQSNMLILQESCTDSTGSYVVYAPVDIPAMNVVLRGEDSDYVALLPSGFAILPDGPRSNGGRPIRDVGSGGSLLTVAFQILVDSVPTAKLSLNSVATINNLIKCTVERIKVAVMPDST